MQKNQNWNLDMAGQPIVAFLIWVLKKSKSLK